METMAFVPPHPSVLPETDVPPSMSLALTNLSADAIAKALLHLMLHSLLEPPLLVHTSALPPMCALCLPHFVASFTHRMHTFHRILGTRFSINSSLLGASNVITAVEDVPHVTITRSVLPHLLSPASVLTHLFYPIVNSVGHRSTNLRPRRWLLSLFRHSAVYCPPTSQPWCTPRS